MEDRVASPLAMGISEYGRQVLRIPQSLSNHRVMSNDCTHYTGV